eukprot:4202796-Prymnesium_polylepis.1
MSPPAKRADRSCARIDGVRKRHPWPRTSPCRQDASRAMLRDASTASEGIGWPGSSCPGGG